MVMQLRRQPPPPAASLQPWRPWTKASHRRQPRPSPLRDRERYCARHATQAQQAEQAEPTSATTGSYVPDGTACAACGGADDLSKDPSDEDGAWYCQPCWDAWERDDPLAAVWSMVMFGGVCE